jgi:iron complex outermembrane recepter protein
VIGTIAALLGLDQFWQDLILTQMHPPSEARPSVTSRKIPPLLSVIMAGLSVSDGLADGAQSLASLVAFKQMSLTELMEIEVTSVSRKSEQYQEAAAALTVVTGEHIRRTGATTVPDALRWVPGLHVARQNANAWAISSRGFSSINSEKLLVQSDTRSIYTPLFSGVFWDVQDYFMADIERIEVIRGPGAAMWGSNAVNGVINITTKSAADTHGTLMEAAMGTEERAMVGVRHGAQTPGGVHYRVFGKYFERDDTSHSAESADDSQLGHAGFRADWATRARDEITVQGDVYAGSVGQLAPAVTIIGRPGPSGYLEADLSGGNILGRWRRRFTDDSNLQFRVYYDRTHRNDPSFTDELDTVDLDLQHHLSPLENHEVIWGLNHRTTSNRNEGKGIFAVRPASSTDQLYSGFIQDQIALAKSLRVTLGSKIEYNDFSGFELQPSLRAAWDVGANHTVWSAVSRAARVPTRLERDIFVDVTNPAGNPVVRLLGNDEFDAEKLIAYELGYRWRAAETVHVDLSLFENHYDGLSSLEIGTPFTDPSDGRTVIPIVNRNLTDGRSRGAETLITFTPFERWRLSASYSYQTLRLEPGGQDLNRGEFYEDATPRHQVALSSYLTLYRGLELDLHFRRLTAIRRLPEIPSGEGIPGYSELDVHLSWTISDSLRVSVVGQNLLDDEHVEFGTPAARGAIQRSVYAKISCEL